jgi:hypothetical protein
VKEGRPKSWSIPGLLGGDPQARVLDDALAEPAVTRGLLDERRGAARNGHVDGAGSNWPTGRIPRKLHAARAKFAERLEHEVGNL